ncbi:MAG: hypothetical protein KJP00_06205 [Bacteroidia bacterium]|nr:hypothetical protein [Bacteroidia bacterium]
MNTRLSEENWILDHFFIQFRNLSEEIAESNDNHCLVLVLGSSLTDEGIKNNIYFHDKFKAQNKNIIVKKIILKGSHKEKFITSKKVLDSIISLKPDLICLEEATFVTANQRSLSKWIHDFNYGVNSFKDIKVLGTINFTNLTTNSTFERENENENIVVGDTSRYFQNTPNLRPIVELELFTSYLKRFRNSGTDIVFLDVQRAGAFPTNKKTDLFIQNRSEWFEIFQSQFNSQYWDYEGVIPFSHYRDFGHLNKPGCEIYSSWLFNMIDSHFTDQCSN